MWDMFKNRIEGPDHVLKNTRLPGLNEYNNFKGSATESITETFDLYTGEVA